MIILAYRPGRLANLMFLTAHISSFCLKNKLDFLNPVLYNYLTYFPNLKEKISLDSSNFFFPHTSNPCKTYKKHYYIGRFLDKIPMKISNRRTIYLDWNQQFNLNNEHLIKLGKKGNVYLQGWFFRDYEGESLYKKEMQYLFKPQESTFNLTTSLINKYRKSYKHIVAIHVRRTDYALMCNGDYFFSWEQYQKWINEINEQLKEPTLFIIFTDEKNKLTNKPNIISAPEKELDDLYLMSLCDYIIAPASTYSVWASYYGNVPMFLLTNNEQKLDVDQFKVCGLKEYDNIILPYYNANYITF